jgi:riboflavin synthase
MFTGLVEDQGTVLRIEPQTAGIELVIDVGGSLLETPADESALFPTKIGDSIAINGCCLTVVEIEGSQWSFQAGTETLSKTSLGQFQVGDRVNLERSLQVGARLGGHIVQGHVDGQGTVAEISREGSEEEPWIRMLFRVPKILTLQMVPKGSVAVDGVSLTLVDVSETSFSVALIPHTLEVTTLGKKQPGDAVNIETDILGKYVQKLLGERH